MNDNLLDEAVEFLDQSFENAYANQIGRGPVTGQSDDPAVQDLFAAVASNYARPIKRFISELERGAATKDWIDVCRPVLQSIMGAAKNLSLHEAARYMADFDALLGQAEKSSRERFESELREQTLACYGELKELLPAVFRIEGEDQIREDIIIRSLLKQVPGVGRVTLSKLYRAGLGSLGSLLVTKAEDLATATSISSGLCERICKKFQSYRTAIESMPHGTTEAGHRSCLVRLVRELRHQEEEIERTVSEAKSKPALQTERHQRQQLRQRCNLQIMVVLAELGELDLILKIQKLSFKRRVQRLEKYLETALAIDEAASL